MRWWRRCTWTTSWWNRQTGSHSVYLSVCLSVCLSRWGDGVGVPGQQAGETDRLEATLSTCLSTCLCVCLDEVMASVYLDNKLVKQTDWKPISRQCWDLKFTLDLDRVRSSTCFCTYTLSDCNSWRSFINIICTYRPSVRRCDIVSCCATLQSRELVILIVCKDHLLCAVKFLRLEDFLYGRHSEQTVIMEPQGILHADVTHCVFFFLWSSDYCKHC